MSRRVEYAVVVTLLLIALGFAASDIGHKVVDFFQGAGKAISAMAN